MHQFVKEDVILLQRRPSVTCLKGVVVVIHRCAVIGGHHFVAIINQVPVDLGFL
ncbi:hypothetical protein FQZ97_785560 [compost metagenome]